jgi:hypothetical protein
MGLAIPGDAFPISKGFIQGRTQANADIFHRMMMVDLDVAARGQVQIHKAVGRQQVQHMVHEGDSGIYRAASRAVDIQRDRYVGFIRFSFDFGFAAHESVPEIFEQEV